MCLLECGSAANEELRSTNDELQTAKEEARSANEELATVNEELRHRNAELARVNNDLANVLRPAHCHGRARQRRQDLRTPHSPLRHARQHHRRRLNPASVIRFQATKKPPTPAKATTLPSRLRFGQGAQESRL